MLLWGIDSGVILTICKLGFSIILWISLILSTSVGQRQSALTYGLSQPLILPPHLIVPSFISIIFTFDFFFSSCQILLLFSFLPFILKPYRKPWRKTPHTERPITCRNGKSIYVIIYYLYIIHFQIQFIFDTPCLFSIKVERYNFHSHPYFFFYLTHSSNFPSKISLQPMNILIINLSVDYLVNFSVVQKCRKLVKNACNAKFTEPN